MRPKWLWDRNIEMEEIQAILRNPEHERFVEFAALLLSRNNVPKEIFDQYLDKTHFVQNWTRIKRRMRKDAWNDPRIIFWQAVNEKLTAEFKTKGITVRPAKREVVRDEYCQRLGIVIKSTRERWKWSQNEVAERLGISQQIISRIENGRNNMCILTLKKISQVLGESFNIEGPPVFYANKISDGKGEVNRG